MFGRHVLRAIRIGAVLSMPLSMLLSKPASLLAQDSSRREEDTCLRFAFGTWTPALDWTRAGHHSAPDSFHVGEAAEGRGWAAAVPSVGADTVLVLFPAFWPVGVSLAFDPRRVAAGDTVVGKATAMVADARKPPPVSRARVWRVPCIARHDDVQ